MPIDQNLKNALLANPEMVYQFFLERPDLALHLEKLTKSYASFVPRWGVADPAEQGFYAQLMCKQIIKIFQSVEDPDLPKGGLHEQKEAELLQNALLPLAQELLEAQVLLSQNEVSWRRAEIDKLNKDDPDSIKAEIAALLSREECVDLVRELTGGTGRVLESEITADFLEKISDSTTEAHAQLMRIFDEEMEKIISAEEDDEEQDDPEIKKALCLLGEDGIDAKYDWKKIYEQKEAAFLEEDSTIDKESVQSDITDNEGENEDISHTSSETAKKQNARKARAVDSETSSSYSKQPSSSVSSSSSESLTFFQKLISCFK